MIIAISGKAGSGKSTVSREIAKKLGLKHYSIGDLMRQMADERNISLLELGKLAENDEAIDKELDDRQIKLGKEEDDFVIDGRLTAFFIPNADLKIFLECDDKIRAERILKDERKEEGKDIKGVIKKINEREESERKRYKQYYNVDYYDEKLYGHIIDTTDIGVKEVVGRIIELASKNS